MGSDLYIGSVVNPTDRARGERFLLDADDLTTHGIVIGMTGSGKTGLSICLIEEVLKAGVPAIVIDPKGDMGNLALAFDRLAPEQFEPWVDRDAATREGQDAAAVAAEAAASWAQGLDDWGLSAADVAAFTGSHETVILTPGSSAGQPLNLIDSLHPPAGDLSADEEDMREQIDAVVQALLGLLKIPADPVQGREYILLFSLIEHAWERGEALSLEILIGQVATPPFEKLGALPVEAVYPQSDRNKLMLALNSLLASPPFEAWRQGSPIDIDAWLRGADGRPRLTIVYTAHLDDEQRIFVTALLLNRIKSWMRRQPGTDSLRCLIYMDEIFGYFPPTANPPTKTPLLTLLKQGRAYGVGVLLSTQNPVDLDYRGLANMGFWAIGRLQTTQDQNRIREGIEAALADSAIGQRFDSLIAAVDKRIFLVHDIHRDEPQLVHSRWALSYLRGPLTRDEIGRLRESGITVVPAANAAAPAPPAAPTTTEPAAAAAPAPVAPASAPASAAPMLPAPLKARYLTRNGSDMAQPYLYVKAGVRYRVNRVATEEQQQSVAFPLHTDMNLVEALDAEPLPVDESQVADSPPGGLRYGELPAYVQTEGARGIERTLKDRLDDRFTVDLLFDPVTKLLSQPGEPVEAFEARVRAAPAIRSKVDTLEKRLSSKRASLESKRDESRGRRLETIAAVGTSILSNVGILFGKKRTVSGVGGVLSKNRMERTSRSRAERLEEEIAEIEEQMAELETVDSTRFETRTVKPSKTDLTLIRYDVLWVS